MTAPLSVLTPDTVASSDLLDLKTLEAVLEVIKGSGNMAEAGRKLFAVSRVQKSNPNDSDWVRKHLVRWDLNYQKCRDRLRDS